MIIGVRRHAANANETMCNSGRKDGVGIYPLVQQFPKELAHELLVIDHDRDYRGDPFQQAKPKPFKLLFYAIGQAKKTMAPLGLPLDYFDGLQDRRRIRGRQRGRVYKSARMMLDEFYDLAARSNEAADRSEGLAKGAHHYIDVVFHAVLLGGAPSLLS